MESYLGPGWSEIFDDIAIASISACCEATCDGVRDVTDGSGGGGNDGGGGGEGFH